MEPNQNPYQDQQQYQQQYQQQQPYPQQQYQSPPGGGQYGNGAASTTSPVEFIRAQAISPAYLVATIAFSLQILFEIFGSSNGIISTLMSYISDMLTYASYYGSSDDTAGLSAIAGLFGGGGISAWSIVSNAPAILIAVGLWLLFASAISKSNPPINTTGMKIIGIIVIINLVLTCISLAGIVLLFLAMMSQTSDTGVFILLMLIFIACYVIQILFYLKVKQTIKCAEIMAEYDQLGEPISMYVPVCCFLLAAGAILSSFLSSILSSILSIISLGTGASAISLASLCSATAYIAFGILVLSIRKKMEQLRYGQAVQIPAKAKISGGEAAPVYYYNEQQSEPQQETYLPPDPQPNSQWEEEQRRQQELWQQEQLRQQEEWQRQQEQLRQQQEEERRRQEQQRQQAEQQQRPVPNPVDPSAMGTVVLNEQERDPNSTAVLTDADMEMLPPAKLMRQKDQTVVAVVKRQFRIGSDRSNVDYCITDNRSISRHHADILYQNGAFYIIDCNSTNHVALNGQRINSNQPYALQNGMQIRLANEDFIWQQG